MTCSVGETRNTNTHRRHTQTRAHAHTLASKELSDLRASCLFPLKFNDYRCKESKHVSTYINGSGKIGTM